jgi:hypothetical protein
VNSLALVEHIINHDLALFADLDADDIPAFMLLFISDGKPSDCHGKHTVMLQGIVACLARSLQ